MRTALTLALASLTAAACTTGAPPTLEPETIPAAIAGRYYEVVFTTSGEASVHSNNVPQGLQLVTGAGHGLLFGVPMTAGQYAIHVSAGSGGPTMFTEPGMTERDYTLAVSPASGDGGLQLIGAFGSFTENVPISLDLSRGVTGGQAPYRFAAYCVAEGRICDGPGGDDRLPDGVALSAEGQVTGVVPPKTGVSADPHDRRIKFIACVTDSASAHACSIVELYEVAPSTPAPAPT